jgi:NADPH:quinone reductase-like Zn-dependent oxidoreductase
VDDADCPRNAGYFNMRAAGITRFGGRVELMDIAEPRPPAADEVLLEVRSAGVANWDDVVRSGSWDVGRTPPLALGVEASGVVLARGADVGDLHVGDAVVTHPLPLRDQGCWAERMVVSASLVARKPDSLSWHEAAVLPVPGLTAYQVLVEAVSMQAGEWLFVHGAGGATGSTLVQTGLALGARVIASAGSSSQQVRALGDVHVVDYRDADWQSQVLTLTAGGVAAAVNGVRGQADSAIGVVAPGGRFATITGDPPASQRGISVSNFYVRADGAQLARVVDLLRDRVPIRIGATYGLHDAGTALDVAVEVRGGGAVVLDP